MATHAYLRWAPGGDRMSNRLHSSAWARLSSSPPALPWAGEPDEANAVHAGFDPAALRHAWQGASTWMLGLWGVGALANEAVATVGLLHDPLFQACFSMGLVLVLGVAWSDRCGRERP